VDVTLVATARRLASDLLALSAVAAELADEAVWLQTRDAPAQDVADALGVTLAAVRKAIQQHNRRQKGLPARTESDKRSRTRRAVGI
jgi:predicted transcriptional regulator